MVQESDQNIGQAKVAVIGVGGGGSNAVNRMYKNKISHIEYATINTDAQALSNSDVPNKLRVGDRLARGMGVGGNPEKGRLCHEEDRDHILEIVQNQDMVFIAAGMGGGTGTGAAPEIAKIAKENGALTIGIVTKPFRFEGPKRMKRALDGIKELKKNCDTLLVIPNEILLDIIDPDTTVNESFLLADSVLKQAAKGISELINNPGDINTDFADVRATMEDMGDAIMGTGVACGEERAVLAAQQAINSPLLQDTSIKGAKNLLLHISGPSDMKMNEMVSASNIIYEEAGEDVNVIFGCVADKALDESQEIHVTVVATGINSAEELKESLPIYNGHNQTTNYFDAKNSNNSDYAETANSQSTEDNKQLKIDAEADSSDDENILKFGEDDLEIPAFLRNSN